MMERYIFHVGHRVEATNQEGIVLKGEIIEVTDGSFITLKLDGGVGVITISHHNLSWKRIA